MEEEIPSNKFYIRCPTLLCFLGFSITFKIFCPFVTKSHAQLNRGKKTLLWEALVVVLVIGFS